MIAGLHGVLDFKGTSWVIVRTGGLSFQVHVPGLTLQKMGKVGSAVDLRTYLHWKGDGFVLYGFSSDQEQQLFQSLLGVSGVGPKLALSLLSTLTVEQFTRAIMSGDSALLSEVPGIGKKTAARLLLEMKGKVEAGGLGVVAGLAEDKADVVAALTALGYSVMEAAQAAEALPGGDASLEDRVKQALKHLARR